MVSILRITDLPPSGGDTLWMMVDITAVKEQEQQARALLREHRGDLEMEALAQEELEELAPRIAGLEEELTLALLPRDQIGRAHV